MGVDTVYIYIYIYILLDEGSGITIGNLASFQYL